LLWVLAFETSRKFLHADFHSRPIKLIGNSLTSFAQIVAMQSGIRIGRRQLQSTGQAERFLKRWLMLDDFDGTVSTCGVSTSGKNLLLLPKCGVTAAAGRVEHIRSHHGKRLF
jgi:hypothetical protein